MDSNLINSLIRDRESAVLEFKEFWYWGNGKKPTQENWGELIKDIISLLNSNSGNIGNDRYLIIGVSDKEKSIFDTDIGCLDELLSLIRDKLNNYVAKKIINLKVDYFYKDSKRLVVFKMSQHPYVFELTKDLKTYTRTYPKNSILVRGIESEDEVSLAGYSETNRIVENLRSYYDLDNGYDIGFRFKSIKETVDEFLFQNKTYSLLDKSVSSGFEVYKLLNKMNDEYMYFVYIHHEAPQKRTFMKIKEDYCDIKNPILLTDRPIDIDLDKRIDNLKKASGWSNVSFIDDFGKDQLYKDNLNSLNLSSEYVQQYFIEGNAIFEGSINGAVKTLLNWYHKENEPLAVIQGVGGIGKTTLAKEFLSVINREINQDLNVLFVDSNEIINELKGDDVYDLYDIYSANLRRGGVYENQFTKNLLRLSVDNGNVLVVIDGLDEIILSKDSGFDVFGFIRNIIKNYSFNLGKCKILLTCRDSFFIEKDLGIKYYMLLCPFDDVQAKSYFNNSLSEDKKKIGKALSYIKRFATKNDNGENNYSPFVLDTIRDIVYHDDGSDIDVDIDFDSFFSSYRLSKNDKNDYLVFSVCKREEGKLKGISTKNQFDFFIYLACHKDGVISYFDIKNDLIENLDISLDELSIEKLKHHPFIFFKDNCFKFRYDFFLYFFKSIKIVKCLVDQDFHDGFVVLDILKDNASLYNDFSKQVARRFLEHGFDSDHLTLSFLMMMEGYSSEIDHFHRSSLFCLYVTILNEVNTSFKSYDLNSALINFYSSSDSEVLDNVSLINMRRSFNIKVEFDFRSLVLRNAYIDGFEGFAYSLFNSETKFIDSKIYNIGNHEKVYGDSVLSADNFINCDLCAGANKLISSIEEKNINDYESSKSKLKILLRAFMSNGVFMPQKEELIKRRRNEFLSPLLTMGVIVYNSNPKINENELMIEDKYKTDLSNFVTSGVDRYIIKKIISAI